MQLLFFLFLSLCVGIWLIGWVCLIAEYNNEKIKWKPLRIFQTKIKKFIKWLCLCLILTICTGCSQTIYVPTNTCPPMLRKATYTAMQADERRDYRIAIEQCNIGEK